MIIRSQLSDRQTEANIILTSLEVKTILSIFREYYVANGSDSVLSTKVAV